MKICFISTYLNHHNKPICEALYEIIGDHFHYVATSNIGKMRRNMGFSQMGASYLLDYANATDKESIQRVIDDADVVIAGASEPTHLLRQRLKQGKLTFRGSERLFKTRSRYLKAPIYWLRCILTRKAYMLCSSAATAIDYNLLGFYKGRCYKWGYFTEVPPIDPEQIWNNKLTTRLKHPGVSILWVARLIRWKHPEVAIQALKKVYDLGYRFDFNLVGDGEVAPMLRKMVDSLGINDCVHLLGAKSTSEVRKYMEQSEIFLFTSNGEEGWGAVLNESMSCACAVVANSEIGSVPFLIKHGVNGLIYTHGSVDELAECIIKLIESESYRKQLGIEAYKTISEYWSPRKAAENLLTLIEAIQKGKPTPILEGPCSISK